jgi:hypothetical protein
MIILPSDQAVFCDVDDTLIMWNPSKEELEKNGISITCPAGYSIIDGELTPSGSWTARVLPHLAHVEQLKRHKARGHTVIVWSAGGWDWAKVAVKALGLEPYVDLVISKPTWIYDDKKAAEFMPSSQWMEMEKK